MSIVFSTFCVPKRGNSTQECEDAFFYRCAPDGEAKLARFAVADGASGSLLSGPWANVLARSFCKRTDASHVIDQDFLARAYQIWARWKGGYLLDRTIQDRPIQWYEEPGLEAGAFSTLTGLTLLEESSMWIATAVGDSCLFHIRRGHVREALPIRDSTDFGNRPSLICSDASRNDKVLDKSEQVTGSVREGDGFYLMTDALASWFLREYEGGNHPWEELARFRGSDNEAMFQEWVNELRRERRLRDDDVVLASIAIS